jgi:hypothetical protein
LNDGLSLNAVIHFVSVAFALFRLVRQINRLTAPRAVEMLEHSPPREDIKGLREIRIFVERAHMKRKMGLILAASLLASAAVAAAPRKQAPPAMPQTTATAFYAVYGKLHPSGIPGARQRVQLGRFLSQRLNGLLVDTDRAEQRYAAATKQEAPPLVEGDLFTSLFEGATSYSVAECTTKGETMASCTISLTNRMDGEPDTTWTDTLLMVREGRSWKIDDIAYGGTWPFANTGHMTDILYDAIAESEKPLY